MPAARTLKLRGDQERRRFFVGVSIDACCQLTSAVLVAASGRGLEARFEVANRIAQEIPPSITAAFQRLAAGQTSRPTESAMLAVQLAELEAGAVDRLAEIENQVWGRTLLIGVTDPGLLMDDAGVSLYISLCDAARLAELTSLNVVDGFPARDVIQNGRGYPLDAIPLWLLLHDPQRTRLLVWTGDAPHTVLLPASRDETGANRVEALEFPDLAELARWVNSRGRSGSIHELVIMNGDGSDELLQQLEATDPGVPVMTAESVGIETAALPSACAAILAMLHIDQVPANLPMLTGAEAPRVLGRLTPGSASAWHRLLRDLAFSRTLITPLRAAV